MKDKDAKILEEAYLDIRQGILTPHELKFTEEWAKEHDAHDLLSLAAMYQQDLYKIINEIISKLDKDITAYDVISSEHIPTIISRKIRELIMTALKKGTPGYF